MQQSTGKPDADPQWFAKAVHHYALIKDGAHTIRSLAREKNCPLHHFAPNTKD